jgi:intracellular septation protein A
VRSFLHPAFSIWNWIGWFFICLYGLATPFVHNSRYLKWLLFIDSAIYITVILTFQSVPVLKPYLSEAYFSIRQPPFDIALSRFNIITSPFAIVYFGSIYISFTESYQIWKDFHPKKTMS